jgi:hypothetical protein
MPTTINDSSLVTKRRNDKIISGSYLTRLESVFKSGYGTPLGVYNNSIMNNINQGAMTTYKKCGGAYEVNTGCPCVSI